MMMILMSMETMMKMMVMFTCIAVVRVTKVGFEVFLSVDPRVYLFKHIMNMNNIDFWNPSTYPYKNKASSFEDLVLF